MKPRLFLPATGVLAVSILGAVILLRSSPPTLAAATLNRVSGLSVNLDNGAVYVADKARSVIFRAERGGTLKPFAGSGASGFNGDKSALETQFNHPLDVAVDRRTGNLLVADTDNYRIREISAKDGQVRTIVGVGVKGVSARQIPFDSRTPHALTIGHFSGDGGPAEAAELNLPGGVCADPYGLLFIADSGNHRVRMVNRGTSQVFAMGVDIKPGEILTIAGTGTMGFAGDGGKAHLAQLAFPTDLKIDYAGNLLLVDSFNQRLRRIDRHSGLIHTVVHNQLPDITAERAMLTWSASIISVAITSTQDIIYTDRSDRSVHRVSRGGDAEPLYAAKGREAEIGDVEVGPNGEIYVTDLKYQRVLRIAGGIARPVLE